MWKLINFRAGVRSFSRTVLGRPFLQAHQKEMVVVVTVAVQAATGAVTSRPHQRYSSSSRRSGRNSRHRSSRRRSRSRSRRSRRSSRRRMREAVAAVQNDHQCSCHCHYLCRTLPRKTLSEAQAPAPRGMWAGWRLSGSIQRRSLRAASARDAAKEDAPATQKTAQTLASLSLWLL